MVNLHTPFHYPNETISESERILTDGYHIISSHPLFQRMDGEIYLKSRQAICKDGAAVADRKGNIFVNMYAKLNKKEWSYVLAHCLLHSAFGHFDNDNIPYNGSNTFNPALWNKACDIYIARFLEDIRFGSPVCSDPARKYSIKLNEERKIYEHLLYLKDDGFIQEYGTNGENMDLLDIDHPIIYKKGEKNEFAASFALALTHSVTSAVSDAGGHSWNEDKETPVTKAATWFLSHYPLLGGIASSFKIIEDYEVCQKFEIHIAAVDISIGEIYANPTARLSEEEWKFVLAHEYLHAGLAHHKRCQGRDKYLWNVACDYVINDWLHEMKVGKMPEEGLLYDKELHGLSAEAIYDIIIKQMRKFKKHATFRGFRHGDIMTDNVGRFHSDMAQKGISLDEFFKNALKEGFDFYSTSSRGYLPAGLVAEIKALSTPPIPWEVELGKWFDYQFPPLEKHRSYARPSRRQGATPDIPRPRYALMEQELQNRTFGVVVDTSGSMSPNQIGLALGAIASYATSKDVPFVRVVFCDAEAYDAGYMTPEDVAGKVRVTGGGGTILQPAVSLLEKAKNFPSNGPILIITDGFIEEKINIRHEHAFLLPKGNKLPFVPKGKVFYFKERGDF